MARRDTGEKSFISMENIEQEAQSLLDTIQKDLFIKAKAYRDEMTYEVKKYDKLKKIMKRGGFAVCGWCGGSECETRVKEETKGTIRLIPFDQENKSERCVACGKDTVHKVYFARAY